MGGVRIREGLSRKIANMGFLSALLVVVIHLEKVPADVGTLSWGCGYFFRNILAIVAVPYFFACSGFFVARHVDEPGWWLRAVVQRLRTLGVPFFFWCLVPFLLFTFIWPVDADGGECGRILMRVSSITAAFGLNIFTVPEACRALWFLRALFLLVLVSPCIVWAIGRFGWWTLAAFFLAYLGLNPGIVDEQGFWLSSHWQFFWKFGFSVEGMFYFAAGMFFWRHPLHVSCRRGLVLGAIGLAVGVVGMFVRGAGGTDFGYFRALSIPFVLTCLWTLVPEKPWPKRMVANSFAVYLMHPMLVRAINASGILPSVAGVAFVEWCAAVASALLCAEILRRFAPRFAGLVFGGR